MTKTVVKLINYWAMNETQQSKTIWQVLESRDKVVSKARQENFRLQKIQKELLEEQTRHIQLITKLNQEIAQLNQDIGKLHQKIGESHQDIIEDIKNQLKRSEEDRTILWQKIDRLQEELNQSQATIKGMESSKFWKLRNQFLKIKSLLQLKVVK